MLVILGLIAALAAGLFNLPWWTALIAGALTIVGAASVSPERTMKATGGGNPLLLAWAVLPCLLLWWFGSLF